MKEYEKPVMEVLKVELEGVICASMQGGTFGDEGETGEPL